MKWTNFSRKWVIRAGAVVMLVAPVSVGALARTHGQPVTQATPAAPVAALPGRSTSTLTRHSMQIGANGINVAVYPADPLHPFDSTDWFAEVPVTVTAVRYDKDRQELLVSVDYNWSKTDADAARAQLAAKYRVAGKPVAADAITIVPLDVAAHSLLVADMDKEYVLFSTEKPRKLTAQTAAFRVPMVAGADRLHERLSTTPDAVQLVLRAGYRFDKIAALTVHQRALNTAWQKVLEKVIPNEAARAEPLLLDRNAEQQLQTILATEVALVIKNYALTPKDEEETLKMALAQLTKLTIPTSPLSVKELLELGDANLVFTAPGGKIEAKPATDEKAITKIKEMRSFSEKVSRTAEAISDIANNSSLDDRRFHSAARKLVLDSSLKVGIKFFSGSGNMHLDKSEEEVTENHLKEIKQARTYAMNRSAYSSDVQDNCSREIEGMLRTSENTAKLLNLRRVSVAALAAQGSKGVSVVRVTGSEVLFIDTPVALKATTIPASDDVVLELVKQLRNTEEVVKKLQQQMAAHDAAILRLQTTAPVTRGTADKGSIRIGDTLICWGKAELALPGGGDRFIREYKFTFDQEFDGIPTVTHGIDTDHKGNTSFVFGVYTRTVTSTGYSGRVCQVLKKPNGEERETADPVNFSFVAVGKAKLAK